MHVNLPPLGWNTWNTFAADINAYIMQPVHIARHKAFNACCFVE